MSLQQWAKLCAVAGVLTRDLDSLDIYLLAGRILSDETVRQHALKYIVDNVMPQGARMRAIANITETDRIALRERVVGVLKFSNHVKNRNEQIARETAKEGFLEPEEEEKQRIYKEWASAPDASE